MWYLERENLETKEKTVKPIVTRYEIKEEFSDFLFDFIEHYCELEGDKLELTSPINNDKLTFIRLAYSEDKGGYYNPYDSK